MVKNDYVNTNCKKIIDMTIKEESHYRIMEINDSGIYNNIPEVKVGGGNYTIEPNSQFKYDYCYYRLESNGELVFISTGEASGRLVIPKSILINGKEHYVTQIGEMVRYNLIYTYYPGSDRRKKPKTDNYVIPLGAFFGTKVTECVFPSTLREFSGNIVWGSNVNRGSLGMDLILRYDNLSKCHLKKISFSDDGTGALESIGSKVFSSCNLEMDCLRLPEGLRHIGEYAFSGKIDKIKLPSTIETIGNNAFWYCIIKSINLPEGLEDVGNNFIDITYCVEKIEFPSTIKRIPQLEWNTSDRWDKALKSLPEIVVNNGKMDVIVDKMTSKNCKIEYVDKTGKREIVKNRVRNHCFRTKKPKDIEDLAHYYSSFWVLIGFFSFMTILITIISILVGVGVLH